MLSFFPRDVLDEIWDLNGSVSEGFPTYFSRVLFLSCRRKIVIKSCIPSIFKVQTVFHPLQDPINTLRCSKLSLNHRLKSLNFPF